MLERILRLLFGSQNERNIKKLIPVVDQINALEEDISKLSNQDLQQQTVLLKQRLSQCDTSNIDKVLNEILPVAFATVREAAWRSIGLRHFDVQLLGGIVLHQGKIAEMKTGEGKTLTATAAIYLNALTGKPVHVVTVNDYLAKRDASWMKPIYDMLGIHVGIIQHNMNPDERKKAYKADITYGTNSEFGFDYLRDNMVIDKEHRVQRGFYFAIVDEVDSILIDEARTPLIISGPTEENIDQYRNLDRGIRLLIDAEKKAPEPEPIETKLTTRKEDSHVIRGYYYDIDEKARNVFLTEYGVRKLEEILDIENLFATENTELVAHSNQSLRAHLIFQQEVDYVVQSGEVVLVDEHTGRTMPGRRYGDGLHQAIEAKERVQIKQESQTLATVTYQNFFRMYAKLSGMTGTADTEAEEFKKIYNLEVVVVPTNVPVLRKDYPDRIYCTEKEKFDAIVTDVRDCIERGQPILVGTISIEKSEQLSNHLKQEGITHNVLNARHHAREAQIIAEAGKPGMVTVATNMAGRGTDIVLGGSPQYLAELDKLEEETELIQQFKNHLLKKQFDEANSIIQPCAQQDKNNDKSNSKFESDKVNKVLQDIYQHSQLWLQEHQRVNEAGGLHIIGTERHEARRIDNQLRGRSGRQGDSGSSRFYLSLEDHLMRIFGGERIKNMMSRLGMQEGQELEAKMVDRAIARAQKRVESHNFDMRKHLLEYDEVMNRQREFVYTERNLLLENQDVRQHLLSWIDEAIETQVLNFCQNSDANTWDMEGLSEWLKNILTIDFSLDLQEFRKSQNPQLKLYEKIQSAAHEHYQKKVKDVGEEAFNYVEHRIALDVIDARWKEHLHQMDQLREGVWASGYAERNPLVEFKLKGFEFFDQMVSNIKDQITDHLFRVQIHGVVEDETKPAQRIQGDEHHENYSSFSAPSNPSSLNQSNLSKENTNSLSVSGGGASRRRSSRRRKR